MSARPYDRFVARRFLHCAPSYVLPGHRYQFKSPDAENARYLYEALVELADGPPVTVDGLTLPCLYCGLTRLVPVLHGSEAPGFSENYISRLRDEVASGSATFVHPRRAA